LTSRRQFSARAALRSLIGRWISLPPQQTCRYRAQNLPWLALTKNGTDTPTFPENNIRRNRRYRLLERRQTVRSASANLLPRSALCLTMSKVGVSPCRSLRHCDRVAAFIKPPCLRCPSACCCCCLDDPTARSNFQECQIFR
jgi:hypothetical protein